jgi:parallel beta-helix repeat protein
MKRGVLSLALLVVLPAVLLEVAPAQAATKISSFGYVITAPGVYQVTQDLSGSGDAITVSASNVDLHLGGHTLSGHGSGVGIHVQGGSPVYNVSIHNGTVQGFQRGIFLGFFALNCKVSIVTASGNTEFGIFLSHANGNTVTNNTADGNGAGISLDASNSNTVTRNTTDGNGNGINVSDNSSGNTVSRNTATSNSQYGIGLLCGPVTQNTVSDNTCSGNGIGIAVGLYGCDDANQNTIQNNTVNYNFTGIRVEQNCTGNTLQGNTALTNVNPDMEDDNPGCDTNIWANNTFATDLVAGLSDGGPGTGCIQ